MKSPVPLLLLALAALPVLAGCQSMQPPMTGTYAPSGIAMVHIPEGTFVMGCPYSEEGHRQDEVGEHRETLYADFYLGKYLVTRAQWRAVMGFAPANPANARDDAPITLVNWDEAMDFCKKITAQERAAGRLPPHYVYTLPTEQQWEYAARAGATGPRYGELDQISWNRNNFVSAEYAVGTKAPNAWGLYDVLGSAWEWCLDEYVAPAIKTAQEEGDIVTALGPKRIPMRSERGGSYLEPLDRLRFAARRHNKENLEQPNIGFRLALVPEERP